MNRIVSSEALSCHGIERPVFCLEWLVAIEWEARMIFLVTLIK